MKAISYVFCALTILLFGLGAIAVPFVLVYLVGAIGTGGNEAVGELTVVGLAMAIGLLGGLGALRMANTMKSGGE